jgi:hypothetical protein
MKSSRSTAQIIAIALTTMSLSLVGMLILVEEVRLEVFNLFNKFLALIISFHDHPAVWAVFSVLAVSVVIYLVVRTILYFSIPSFRKAHSCPACKGHIQRVHRRKPERVLAAVFMLHIGRFGCLNCNWSGLRRYHKHESD